MKYVELDFTPQLERTIRQKEESLEKLLRDAMETYSPSVMLPFPAIFL
jgi:hypothetical protein